MHRHSSINRLYRLVWNQTLMLWTAVAETAKGRGKTGTGRRRMAALLALNSGFMLGPPAMAGPNGIHPDGRTATTLQSSGNVTDVRTGTLSGGNAFNSFTTFTVGSGQVVNLHVPGSSSNLINLVSDQRTTVHGILNSIKNDKIGGNVYFANPQGFLVSSGGVVNVGSLMVSTPSRAFVDNFFLNTGDVDAVAVEQLFGGTAERAEGSSIDIDGTVNASGSVNLNAGSVSVGGTIYRGARFVSATPDFSDVVNANGLAAGTRVVEVDGRIEIVAETDVTVSGTIVNEGSEGVDGGAIDIQAGNDLALQAGAKIVASGQGANSAGGTVNMYAANNAVSHLGALVDASGGSSGNGGAIEFSARKTVELAGGEFRADVLSGSRGSVLIDPENIVVSADIVRGSGGYGVLPVGGAVSGASLTLEASDSITINTNVTVSSRSVAADHKIDVSTGNSGDITFSAANITLKAGASVLADADNGFSGGTVTLEAKQTGVNIVGYRSAVAKVQIGEDSGGATVRGNSVLVTANALAEDEWILSSGDPKDNAINVASKSLLTVASVAASTIGIDAVYSQANAEAQIVVKGGSTISAAGDVELKATTTSTAGARPLNALIQGEIPVVVKTPLAIGGLYARVDAKAEVQVDDGATIMAGNFSALARNDATVNASIDAKPTDSANTTTQILSVGVGITEADVKSRASIGGTLDVAGKVLVTAINEGSYSNEVVAGTGGNGRAAAAVAYSQRSTDATAELTAQVRDATKVQVAAVNDIVKDFVTAESTAGKTAAGEIRKGLKTEVANSAKTGLSNLLPLDSLKAKAAAANPDAPTQVNFRLAGAIAYADHKDEAHASIGGSAKVHASESIAVTALVNAENTKIAAESSAVSNSSQTPSVSDTSREGYSVGLTIGNFEHNATADIGAGVILTAPRVGVAAETVLPMRDSLLFGDTQAFDRWTDLSSLTGAVQSVTNVLDVFNGVSVAKAKGDSSDGSIALSGSMGFLTFDHTSRALVEEGARINLSGNASGAWSSETLALADAKTKTIPLTGIVYDTREARNTQFAFSQAAEVRAKNDTTLMFQGGPVIPSSNGSEKGLGMSLNDIEVNSRVEALVREGVVITGITESAGAGAAGSRDWSTLSEVAAREVNIAADNQDKVVSLTSTSGFGATFGITGSVSIVTVDATTLASLDDEASVRAQKLVVQANASPVLWSLAGGINLSKGASVGVGIAVNDVSGDTLAQIADNDSHASDGGTRSSKLSITPYSASNLLGARISVPSLSVLARTGGRIEAVAVTGSVASQSDSSGGFFSGIKGKYDAVLAQAQATVSLKPQTVTGGGGSAQPGLPQKPSFGLSAAGSAAVNTTDMFTQALIEGVSIDQGKPAGYTDEQSLVVRSVSDSDISTATGAAAVTRANASSQTSATSIAGSIAVNQIGNGNEAVLRNSTLSQTDAVAVQALSGGEQLSVAIGAAVDASKSATVSRKTSVVGSLSLTLAQLDADGKSKNFTRALIDNTTLSGDAAASDREVEVTAYNRTFIGTGGGALALQLTGGTGSATSVGGAVTYTDIRNDVDSRIRQSTLSAIDSVTVSAFNATEIGAGAAMGGASAVSDGNNVAGAFVISEITNNTTASIDSGSVVSATQAVTVQAKDQGADSAFESLIDPSGQRNNVVKGLDYCGGSAGAGLTPGGNCITSVAGVLQLSRGNNVGASASYNLIENNLTAQIENAKVSVSGAAGSIKVQAESTVDIVGIAAGVGVSSKLSGAGSVSIAEIRNHVTASASRSSTAGSATELTADTIQIEAKDGSSIQTLGGQISGSTQSTAVGAAVTYNDIENTLEARADGATLSARDEASVKSLNESRIESVAVAGAAANGAAVSASISLNFIKNSTTSHSSATFDDPDGGTNRNRVTVSAEDHSTIDSLAGSVAVGKTAGAGAAFAYNHIGNTVSATLNGANVHRAAVLELSAKETARIRSLSVAAGAGKDLALSGSVSLNVIGNPDLGLDGNVVKAELLNATVDAGSGAVIVKAEDSSTIESLAGAVSVSLGGAAVGGAVADNSTHNLASARVDNSSLKSVSSLLIQSQNTSVIESLSVAGSGSAALAFAGSASSNRIVNRTEATLDNAEITGATADVDVLAIDKALIRSLAGAVAIGNNTVGAGIAVNRIANQTTARVSGKKAGSDGLAVSDLLVKSDALETIETIAVSGAGGGQSAGAGSFAINKIASDTQASIDGDAVVESEGNVAVVAESDDRITASAGAIGVGLGGAGVGASVVVNEIGGITAARIENASVAARAKIGTTAVSVASGGLGDVKLGDGLDNPAHRPDLIALREMENVKGVVVNASATHNLQNGVINVGAGLYAGISGVANVNTIGGTTKATISNADINQGDNSAATADQSVQVKASDHAYATNFVGGVAAGAVGVGLTVDVALFDRDTRATVSDSTVAAKGAVQVKAQSAQGMSTLVVGAAGGIVGIAGAGTVAQFTSSTEARVSGSDFSVGSLDVQADHVSRMFLSGGAAAVGGVGVGATFDVGLDNSETLAHIDDSSVTTSGQVNVDAASESDIHQWTVAGALAGSTAAAGTASVTLVGNKTQAWIEGSNIGSDTARAAGLSVTAKDTVSIEQNAGSLALGGAAGMGVGAAVTKLQNTTSAYLINTSADVLNDVVVDASATRDLKTTVATIAGGISAGIGGSIGVTLVGTALSNTQSGDANANRELDQGGSGTLSSVNAFSSGDALGSSNTTAPSENGYAGAGLSSAEVAALNSRTQLDTKAQIYGTAVAAALGESFDPATQLTGKTAAVIAGSSDIDAGRSVKVVASETDRISVLTGGAAAGGLAGIGGSVSVVNLTNNVEAAILGATQTTAGTGKVEVLASVGRFSGSDAAVKARAYQAAGGAVALGAAVAIADVSNNVKATIGRGTTTSVLSGAGNVNVHADDSTDIETQALGLSMGLVAAGVVIDRADKSGSVVARVGNELAPSSGLITEMNLDSGTLDVTATRSGAVSADAKAGAGGILAGSGADARATDSGEVKALVGNAVQVTASAGKVNVAATATPQTSARALGVSVGAGAVGASLATAVSNATVEAKIGTSAQIVAGQLDVTAQRLIGAGPSALAAATGASGGLLFGVNATFAQAKSSGSTQALVGLDSTLDVTGRTTVKADSASQQTSSGVGISVGGLVAIGADYSSASSDTKTEAALADGVKVTGQALNVEAKSRDINYAHGVAGSGGMISAPFSKASTSTVSETTARTGSGNNTGGNARKIDVGILSVTASHGAQFDSWMENTNASLIGASGAQASNTVNATTEAHIGTEAYVEADAITMLANNDVNKGGPAGGKITGLDDVNVPGWNVSSSSGGLADLPAAGSDTHITTHALTQVGAGAHLEQTGSRTAPGHFTLDAANKVIATDRVTLSSGGAISAASGRSTIEALSNDATVRVGALAEVSGVGDIAMGAVSTAKISTQVAVDIYGAVGVAPEGDAVSIFKSVNAIDIGAGSTIESLNDIKLYAGASSSAVANSLEATARSDVFNNTFIPVNRDPVADAEVGTHSQITIAAGAELHAVRHVSLFAEKGTAVASGVGIGKDLWREALAAAANAIGLDVSFETRTGNAIKTQTSDVAIEGEVHVGTQRKQELVLGMLGAVTSSTDGISVVHTEVAPVGAKIVARIAALRSLIAAYLITGSADDAEVTIAVAAYEAEIAFLERSLKDMGFTAEGTGGFAGVASVSPLQAATNLLARVTSLKTSYETAKVTLTAANLILVDTNTALLTDNTTRTNSNTTLNGQIVTLTATNVQLQDDLEALPGGSGSNTERTALEKKIADNQALILGYTGEVQTNTDTIQSNLDGIAENSDTIGKNEVKIARADVMVDRLALQGTDLSAAIARTGDDALSDQIDLGPVATYVTVSDTVAQLGNIYVRADKLHGAGTLDAPGDAEIRIVNNGPAFLVLQDLIVPPDDGGRLYFNSVEVANNSEINTVNSGNGAAFTVFNADSAVDSSGRVVDPAKAGKPLIEVVSNYDPEVTAYRDATIAADQARESTGSTPLPPTPILAPDIILRGNVSNLRGDINISSAAGSIMVEESARISGNDIAIKTRNGDYVQSYSNSMRHVAGAPLTTRPADPLLTFPKTVAEILRTPENGTGGIVANGSVLIAARYLNINGTVQSGIPEWGVLVPSNAHIRIGTDTHEYSFEEIRAVYAALSDESKAEKGAEFYTVKGTTVDGLSGNEQGKWEPVTVRYNAKENRLELDSVRVQGGYIELFGEIFNTNQNGGGKLRVLDGYGQIKIDNQTDLAMWVNPLDTGKGATGEIKISSFSSLDANNLPVVTTKTFARTDLARTGDTYQLQDGLRYTMTVGYDQIKENQYLYSQSGWFNGATKSAADLEAYQVGSNERTNDPLAAGEYLKVDIGITDHYEAATPAVYTAKTSTQEGSITGGQSETLKTAPDQVVLGNSWRDCNWWTLCANATHYQEITIIESTKTTFTESVKANYGIGIEYIGFDQGKVDVVSKGNVVINGSVNNRVGETRISSQGSITQADGQAIVGGDTVALAAGTGIGSAAQAVQVNVKEGGRLDATSGSGEVRVTEMLGSMKVGQIGGAGVSNVVLKSDGNLVNFDANSVVQGQRVELQSVNGAIGAAGDALKVRTGYTTNQAQWPNNGLMATARENINIQNGADAAHAAVYNGNLLLISAESLSGDVRIETSGAVIDNNPYATNDTRTQTELANLWDELSLRGTRADAKAVQTVLAFEKGKTNNYQLYWQLRKAQPDQGATYNPAYRYVVSAGERAALEASGVDVTLFATNRTTQYHALHAEVGVFTASYDKTFNYVASTEEAAQLKQGAKWSESQLALSVGAGLLKNVTDTVTTIKEPNVKGNNIQLIAGTAIGSMNDELTIDLTVGLSPSDPGYEAALKAMLDKLTTEQKAALAAAERGDTTVTGSIVKINSPRSVNVAVGTGTLTASAAAGSAYIGSEQDIRIDSVSATEDVRIKTAGALINAASALNGINVKGRQLILEAASGGIGSMIDTANTGGQALRVSSGVGGSLIARAAKDIWIETPGALTVDTVYSRQDLKLDAVGSILDIGDSNALTPDLNLLSNDMTLISRTGSIGSASDRLDVGVNAEGRIYASADTSGQGVYLNAPSGEYFNIGAISSGDTIDLSADNDLLIDGTVTAPGQIGLTAGGLLTLSNRADLSSTSADMVLRAGELTMQDDGTLAARVHTGLGRIDIETDGDAALTGIESGRGSDDAVRIVSLDGRVLDAGDTRLDVIADTAPGARLDIRAAKGIGTADNALDTRLLKLQAASSLGDVNLAMINSVEIESVSAGDAVRITATGDITGGSVTSTGLGMQSPDKTVSIASTGGNVTLSSVSGTSDISVASLTGLNLGTVTSTGGGVTLESPGNIVTGDISATDGVVVNSSNGSVNSGEIRGGGDFALTTRGDIVSGSINSRGSVELVSLQGSITAERTRAADTVAMTARNAVDVGRIDAGDDITLTSTRRGIEAGTLLSRGGSVEMRAPGAIEVGSGTAQDRFFADSTRSDIRVGTVNADAIDLNARGNLNAAQLNVGSDLQLMAGGIQASVSSAGEVTGSVMGYGGAMASDVQLWLASPNAFRFSDLSTQTGALRLSAGDLYVKRMQIGQRLTVSNPRSQVLIDQTSRSIQDFDLQLYSGGAAFDFGLTGNRLLTDAYLVHRDRLFEVISPRGNNTSALEQADDLVSELAARRNGAALGSGFWNLGLPGEGTVVSFSGLPLALEPDKRDCTPENTTSECEEKQ